MLWVSVCVCALLCVCRGVWVYCWGLKLGLFEKRRLVGEWWMEDGFGKRKGPEMKGQMVLGGRQCCLRRLCSGPSLSVLQTQHSVCHPGTPPTELVAGLFLEWHTTVQSALQRGLATDQQPPQRALLGGQGEDLRCLGRRRPQPF